MNFILYVLAALGIAFILVLFWTGKIAMKVKKEFISEPRNFNSAVELMSFIRGIYECKLEHKVMLYGFVETVNYNDGLLNLSDPVLDLRVAIITKNGHEKINSTCGNIKANLKKGDFVAILPIHNQRHDLWVYLTAAKLEYYYLGDGRGFAVNEQYID